MKIEIEISIEHEKEEDMPMGKPKQLSAFLMKVARMLAKKNGRSKSNEMDIEKAKYLEEEESDD